MKKTKEQKQKGLKMSRILKSRRGITLASLVITIIILIILAGVGIGLLGPNGLIEKAEEAKLQAQIDEEREIVGISATHSAGANRYGNVEKAELEIYLAKNAGDRPTEVIENGETIIVEFKDTNRYYEIDANGDVKKAEIIIDQNPGDITVGINGEELDGTSDKPFEIWCIEDLVEFSQNYTRYLTSNIKLCTTLNFNSKLSYSNGNMLGCTSIEELKELLTNTSGAGFTPIANFNGNFDGQDFEIQNLYINTTGDVGLFAKIAQTGQGPVTIKNLTVTGKVESSDKDAGGIVGVSYLANILNCTNFAEVTSNNAHAGGIVGKINIFNGGTLVENCYNYGNVIGATATGGIAGGGGTNNVEEFEPITINNCINYGNLTSTNEGKVGGIYGYTGWNVVIKNCYNSKETLLNGKDVGGIVGHCQNTKIYNCYNLGTVEGTSTAGGIMRICLY